MYNYNNTTSTQSTVSKWLSTNGYKFFISVQLPAHLKSNNLDKSTRCLKKILKSIEKDLLGRRWHKHHLPFLIFAEKGEQNATFHFHILVCDNNGARNFDFFTFYWVVQRTIKKFGFNQQNIDCKEITETPEKLCGYVVKELVVDNNHHVNSERIIPSTILFNL